MDTNGISATLSGQSEVSGNGIYHWIFHVQKQLKLELFHNQIYKFGKSSLFWVPKMATHGHFGHSDQSEVSKNDHFVFPITQNLGNQ